MEKTVKILSGSQPIDLFRATVVHANKYDRTSGGWGYFPVISTLYTDVVFRSEETGADWSVTIVGDNLPVYTQQEVHVIVVNKRIIGYIDSRSYKYYYTSEDFHRLFNLGIKRHIMWFAVALSLVIAFFGAETMGAWLLILPLGVVVGYYIQKWVINYQVGKSLDQFLSNA